jgi:hypothetical protein
MEPSCTRAEQLYRVHGTHGAHPTDPPAGAAHPLPAVPHVGAFVAWASGTCSRSRGAQVLDRSDAAQIDWERRSGSRRTPAVAASGAAPTASGG